MIYPHPALSSLFFHQSMFFKLKAHTGHLGYRFPACFWFLPTPALRYRSSALLSKSFSSVLGVRGVSRFTGRSVVRHSASLRVFLCQMLRDRDLGRPEDLLPVSCLPSSHGLLSLYPAPACRSRRGSVCACGSRHTHAPCGVDLCS